MLIIGAGISGIGAAYRIHEKNPKLSYTVLERRERIGGTWDLFRYPGIRSDSDIFTLSYPYEPWTRPENVADGHDIREYLTQTARKHGIDEHIRFNTRVLSADWDSTTDTWTVQTEQDGAAEDLPRPLPVLRHRLLQLRRALPAGVSRASRSSRARSCIRSTGPSRWTTPASSVVVIGSGATAVSMIPSLTEKAGARDHAAALTDLHVVDAAHPPGGAGDPKSAAAARPATRGCRLYNTCFTVLTYVVARKAPQVQQAAASAAARNRLCPKAIPSTSTSSPAMTRGTSGCA